MGGRGATGCDVSVERSERQRRALPVLRRMRAVVADGATLLDALLVEGDCGCGRDPLDREFARHELLRALAVFRLELEPLDRYGDPPLRLYFVDRALRACGALHRGGHFVTGGRRSTG